MMTSHSSLTISFIASRNPCFQGLRCVMETAIFLAWTGFSILTGSRSVAITGSSASSPSSNRCLVALSPISASPISAYLASVCGDNREMTPTSAAPFARGPRGRAGRVVSAPLPSGHAALLYRPGRPSSSSMHVHLTTDACMLGFGLKQSGSGLRQCLQLDTSRGLLFRRPL